MDTLYITNTARCDEMIDRDTVLIQVRSGGDGPMYTDTTVGYFYEESDARLMVLANEMAALLTRFVEMPPDSTLANIGSTNLKTQAIREARALLARVNGEAA